VKSVTVSADSVWFNYCVSSITVIIQLSTACLGSSFSSHPIVSVQSS